VPRHDSFTDNHVWIPGLIGIALITGFVLHALHRADHPLIDLALFKESGGDAIQLRDVRLLRGVFSAPSWSFPVISSSCCMKLRCNPGCS